jgi:HAMP domain-containing protein
MTLQRKLALRYAGIVGVCLLLLGGLAHHEFGVEPRVRQQMGMRKPSGSSWGEIAEIVFHALIPVTLGVGWWFMRRTLAPIDSLARGVEQVDAGNLREPLRRSGNGDEVDRLTAAFNAMAGRLDRTFQRIHEFTLHATVSDSRTRTRVRSVTAQRSGSHTVARISWGSNQSPHPEKPLRMA